MSSYSWCAGERGESEGVRGVQVRGESEGVRGVQVRGESEG